jgi:hypothetical protein
MNSQPHTPSGAPSREQIRQRLLMQALQSGRTDALQGWLWQPLRSRTTTARGLAAYVANAGASAERALAARYPTVQALLGEDSLGQLARALWRQRPPQRGDLAQWGHDLPDFIAADAQLAGEPYLADCARLDALVAQADSAADAEPDLATLTLLGAATPEQLRLRATPGIALLRSAHPVVAIWRAHHDAAQRALPDPFAEVRMAMAEQRGQIACVWRQGWQVRVAEVSASHARLIQHALIEGQPLSQVLEHDTHTFEPWLLQAIEHGWLLAVETNTSQETQP